jgi:serine phosphatase RsbU (regulator of sigma subunit)
MMTHPWIAISEPAPLGFEFRQELLSRDLRRAAFALYADSVEQAEIALEPFRGKVHGLILTYAETATWESRGEDLYHLALPAQLQSNLATFLPALLTTLQRILKLTDSETQKNRDLIRAAEDRHRLVKEFSDLRDSLLSEIEERRLAQEKLQEAHDQLEVRVQERTADLAAANESLKQAWDELSRSHKELIKIHGEMEADLDLAREFQVSLLPHYDPEFTWGGKGKGRTVQLFHFYEPSGSVGGDFYHLLRFPDKTTGIFFCDVMGHGVRSALTSAILRGQVEELKQVGPDPGHLLTAINQHFHKVLKDYGETIFATAFLMVVDLEKLELRYANAGHPHPLFLNHASHTAEPMPHLADQSGPALGILPDISFKTAKCPIQFGDRVLMFTDGIFEVIGPDNEEFGEERLLQTVESINSAPIPDLLGRIVERSRSFSAKGLFDDDICLVAMQFIAEK